MRAKGQNHLPRPAGHASIDAAQDTVGFLAASAHCQLTLSFSSTSTPKSLSSGLLSSHSLPNLYLCLGLPLPMCRTLHLALLNFMMVLNFTDGPGLPSSRQWQGGSWQSSPGAMVASLPGNQTGPEPELGHQQETILCQ